jgi:phosphoglycerate dehydrogenase-like enzyme
MAESVRGRVVVQLNAYSPYRLWSLGERAHDRIARSARKGVRVVQSRDRAAFLRLLPESAVLYTWSLPRRHFVAATKLRWIHTPEGGAESLLYPEMVKSKVVITNSRGVSSDAIADHAMALVLALTRRLHDCMTAQRQWIWARDLLWSGEAIPVALEGSTMLVVGTGSIGAAVARRARSFGVRVTGYRRQRGLEPPDGFDRVGTGEDLVELLAEADIVVVTLPLTRETRNLFDRERIEQFRPGAVLVNVGRGNLLDERALVEALASGRIAGAGLDVFENEPLPRESPLWGHPKVILTPHVAATDPHHMERATDLFEQNLERFLNGEPLLNVVDKKLGY